MSGDIVIGKMQFLLCLFLCWFIRGPSRLSDCIGLQLLIPEKAITMFVYIMSGKMSPSQARDTE